MEVARTAVAMGSGPVLSGLTPRRPAPFRGDGLVAVATLMSRHRLGRLIQLVGLAIPPLAIASNVAGDVGLGRSLLYAAGGVVVFYLGVAVQGQT